MRLVVFAVATHLDQTRTHLALHPPVPEGPEVQGSAHPSLQPQSPDHQPAPLQMMTMMMAWMRKMTMVRVSWHWTHSWL